MVATPSGLLMTISKLVASTILLNDAAEAIPLDVVASTDKSISELASILVLLTVNCVLEEDPKTE